MILEKTSPLREAPPTRKPSMSFCWLSSFAFLSLTEPPANVGEIRLASPSQREREIYFKSHISWWEHSSHFRLIGRGVPSVSAVSQLVYEFLNLASPKENPQGDHSMHMSRGGGGTWDYPHDEIGKQIMQRGLSRQCCQSYTPPSHYKKDLQWLLQTLLWWFTRHHVKHAFPVQLSVCQSNVTSIKLYFSFHHQLLTGACHGESLRVEPLG